LVPDVESVVVHWTPRVWPGGLLVEGEIVGTWRRAQGVVVIRPGAVSRAARDAVEAGGILPLPGIEGRIIVRWD
jgi:hypothetical protein